METLTLEQAYYIGELVAAFGVITSLLYVGFQIRETKKAVRAATAQARTDLGVQLISSRYSTNIADILVKSTEHPESLSDAEQLKLRSFFTAHVRHGQNLFYQKQQGLLDEYFSYGLARTTTYWVRNYPWARDAWKQTQDTVPPEFKSFINEELEKHPEAYDA